MALSSDFSTHRKQEMLGLFLLSFTALLFLALATDGYRVQEGDPRFIDGMTEVPNLFGRPGAVVASVLAIAVGDAAHMIYAVTFVWSLMLIGHRPLDRMFTRMAGIFILTFACAGLLQVDLETGASNPEPGGVVGAFIMDQIFAPRFGGIGANIAGITMVTIGMLLTTDFLLVHVVVWCNRMLFHLFRGNLFFFDAGLRLTRRVQAAYTAWSEGRGLPDNEAASGVRPLKKDKAKGLERIRVRPGEGDEVRRETPFEEPSPLPSGDHALDNENDPGKAAPDTPAEEAPPSAEEVLVEEAPPKQAEMDLGSEALPGFRSKKKPRPRRKNVDIEELPADYEYPKRYTKPPLDIFEKPGSRVIPNLTAQLRSTSVQLEETLQTFNIEARVTDVTRGPTITRFELEPAPGVKVSRFQSLADDIALALKAQRVRVEAPIPGKGRVGIEVPNKHRDPVVLRELLDSRTFQRGKGKLKLALGKDISGESKIADLATMPHLLVAGATGAGKTVCVKALLASLLCHHTPDELQLMLIDPKMVELSIFNDIPHLITPVVIDPKKASGSLGWLINEMEERYRLFADLRVRNIEVYNQSVDNGEIEMEGEEEEATQSVSVIRKLPYIVCIIDELADLMIQARSEVEDAIARLAQLARAVGIHLIIATQRPSVDVLTGVIKANFPARISFQVSSRVDSRCILDEIGAERLIGMGDLLFLPAGQSKPYRIQGAFVSDEEMSALIAHLKRQAPPQYRDEIENFGKSKDSLNEIQDEDDPLFEDAVQVVLDTGQASISMVQRRLRVGYTRAARLIDMMELRGIVGPHTGSKAREILVDSAAKDEVA